MATVKKGPESSKQQKGPSQEEIIRKFQTLRNEQRDLALKISEIEVELGEHRWVTSGTSKRPPAHACFIFILFAYQRSK